MNARYIYQRVERDQFLDGSPFFSCVDEMLQHLGAAATKSGISRQMIEFPASGSIVGSVVTSTSDYVSGDAV